MYKPISAYIQIHRFIYRRVLIKKTRLYLSMIIKLEGSKIKNKSYHNWN